MDHPPGPKDAAFAQKMKRDSRALAWKNEITLVVPETPKVPEAPKLIEVRRSGPKKKKE
jgi:hypothetical protein